MVIEELRKIQEKSGGFLPSPELESLSRKINLPLYELRGVASFYPEFRFDPPAKAHVKVCLDAACHAKNSHTLLERLLDEAGRTGEKVEVVPCSCLGQCDRAPAMLINDQPAGGDVEITLALARSAIAREKPAVPTLPALRPAKLSDPYPTPDEHYTQLRKLAASKDFDHVLKQMELAELRGMGGAGFEAFKKWAEIRKAKNEAVVGTSSLGGLVNPDARVRVVKYVVCNADESEVGTFKDREILLAYPHLLVEAMAIAAMVCGCTRGYIYIRHEYHDQAHACELEIERATKIGALGKNIFGSGHDFQLEVFVSPGGYIMGEQTALLEAIEGKRGQPRNRRTDIGAEGSASINGLFNGPTLINNVETFAHVPKILSVGGDAWAALGTNGKKGLKWVGVAGDVRRPGVFEVPLGTTYRELLEMAGGINGHAVKAFAPSGPSYGLHLPDQLDTPTDFRHFIKDFPKPGVGSGAIMFFNETRCVVDLALNLTQFFRNESCGKCVPCRVGSSKMVDLIREASQGKQPEGESLADVVDRLAATLNITSICGLGQVVHMPIWSVLKNWPEAVDAHLRGECSAGVCGKVSRRA